MSKIGRNEPCPCGSGKKYKKCCGYNIITDFDSNAVNQELYGFHEGLISFTANNYDQTIDQQVDSYDHEEEMKPIYKTGLLPWIVIKKPIIDETISIFKAFLQKNLSNLSLPARQTLLNWMEREPSVYQVISIDYPKRNFAQIKNIAGKKETHLIPYDDAENFPQGSLVEGIVVPFLEHDNFLFSMIRLFNENKVHFQKLILKHHDYPSLLRSVLQDGLFNGNWLQPQHEEVADLFATYASDKGYDNNSIAEAILLWSNYCKKIKPVIQKPETHASALAYFFEKDIKHNQQIRQAEVADEFGTSPSTLSALYRRLANELNDY